MARNFTVWLGILVAPALCAQSEDFGKWVSLFNGKDTTGWVKAKADETGPLWKVEDGAMTNGQDAGVDLATADSFDNYELELEYKLPKRRTPDFRGNSGVYLRAFYEVQIFDSYGVPEKELNGTHAGSIYAGSVALKNPQNPPGEWNKYKIRHIGKRITVWHNGVLVQDDVYVDTPTNLRMEKDPKTGATLDGTKGPIMLQGNHTQVWYKNIKCRPLASPADGWRPLWNGKDLSEFRSGENVDVTKFWSVKDHAFGNGGPGGKDLWTKESFGNFLVHYEYRCDKEYGGNSGFYLRDQWEIQIYKEQNPSPGGKHADGALYSMYPPMVKARNEPLQWNQMDVKVDGMKIWVWQSGTLIHDGIECKRRTDNENEPTLTWSKKPFKLQGDHDKIYFSNLFIKPLPDSK